MLTPTAMTTSTIFLSLSWPLRTRGESFDRPSVITTATTFEFFLTPNCSNSNNSDMKLIAYWKINLFNTFSDVFRLPCQFQFHGPLQNWFDRLHPTPSPCLVVCLAWTQSLDPGCMKWHQTENKILNVHLQMVKGWNKETKTCVSLILSHNVDFFRNLHLLTYVTTPSKKLKYDENFQMFCVRCNYLLISSGGVGWWVFRSI